MTTYAHLNKDHVLNYISLPAPDLHFHRIMDFERTLGLQ